MGIVFMFHAPLPLPHLTPLPSSSSSSPTPSSSPPPLPSSSSPPPLLSPSSQCTMIGGVFVYNHKGEVLISRVYRDNVT